MRYNGPINDAADIINKGYLDEQVSKLKQNLETDIQEQSTKWGTFGEETSETTVEDFISELQELPDGAKVKLGAGSITQPIVLTNGISILGEAASQPQNFKQKEIVTEMSTIISEKITIQGDKEFIFDGVDFTKKGYVTVTSAAKLVFQNCRIHDLDAIEGGRAFWLQTLGDKETKIIIENCYFGDNPNVYNIMELNAKLLDGSSFSNNYFTANCCTHNAFGIYGVKDKANIYLNKNKFEDCKTLIRIGVKGEPVCNFMLDGNIIEKTESDSTNSNTGLVICQPYGKLTKTFSNMSIFLNNTTCPTEQKICAYSGASDTELTQDNVPKIYIDGDKLNSVPIYH